MEEIEIVKQMFTEPAPAQPVLAAGRQRVIRGTQGNRSHAAWFRVAGIALAATTAAAVIAVVVGGGRSGDTGTGRAVHLTAAQEVLTNAARTADGLPTLTPEPNQWIYYRFAGYDAKRSAPVYRDEAWLRLDGQQDASRIGGRIVVSGRTSRGPEVYTPLGAWRRLAGLPTEPGEMLAALRHQPDLSPTDAGSADGPAFANAAELMWNSPLGAPPRVQAALYRALATLPGIRVDEAADVVGEPAVGLSLPGTPEILFDPATYRYLGERVVSDGIQKKHPQSPAGLSAAKLKAWQQWAADPANLRVPPEGTLVSSRLRLVVKLVDKPGSR